MIRVLLVIGVLASGVTYMLYQRNVTLGEQLSEARVALRGREVSIHVLSRQLAEMSAEAERWRGVAEELEALEGRDEPLNDYERAVLDRVRNP